MRRPHPLLSFPSFQIPWPSLEAGTCSPPHQRQRRFLLLRILPRPTSPESALSPAAEPDSVETPGRVWRTVHARDLLTGSVRRFQVLSSVGDGSVIGGPDGPDQPPDGDHDPPPGAPAACRSVRYEAPEPVSQRVPSRRVA